MPNTEPPATPHAPQHPTLFERMGGEEAVERLIDSFYEKVLADEELGQFFEGVSMDSLRRMQREFFAAALDGPSHYTGRPLSEAHHGRGIEARHLRRFLDHLLDTLEDQVDDDEVLEIISRINRYVGEITGGGDFAG